MPTQWRSFLEGAGAVFQEEKLLHFGDPAGELRAAVQADILTDLSHLFLLRIAGQDAQKFLQGQLTSDIRRVAEQRGQWSAWCSNKGRVLANFYLFMRQGVYYLQLPRALASVVHQRLKMFVLRSDIQLADASQEFLRIGLAGERIAERLQEIAGAVPAGIDDVLQAEALTVLRLRGQRPRFEVIGPGDGIQALWISLAREAKLACPQAWGLLDLLAGVPAIQPATSDQFIPQMLNLQHLDGVSFTKGCYSGQEIVARTQHLGKLKRRMYLAQVATETAPQPGDSVYLAGVEGEGSGKVVNAEAHPEGGHLVLAVLPIEAVEAGTPLCLWHGSGPLLRLQPLAYA